MKAFAETAASTQLRNAILRQTRRVPDDYLPGQKVGFWRTQGRQGNRRKAGGATMRPGYLVGTVIGRQPPSEGSNIIVDFKGKQYLVSPENCRPAVGFEHWTPTEEDVEILRHAEEDLREGPPYQNKFTTPDHIKTNHDNHKLNLTQSEDYRQLVNHPHYTLFQFSTYPLSPKKDRLRWRTSTFETTLDFFSCQRQRKDPRHPHQALHLSPRWLRMRSVRHATLLRHQGHMHPRDHRLCLCRSPKPNRAGFRTTCTCWRFRPLERWS